MRYLKTYADLEQREADLIDALESVETQEGYQRLLAALALVQGAMMAMGGPATTMPAGEQAAVIAEAARQCGEVPNGPQG